MNIFHRLVTVPYLTRKLKGVTPGYIDTLDEQVDERPALYDHDLIHWLTQCANRLRTRPSQLLFFKLTDCLQQRSLGLTNMEPRQIRGFRLGKDMPRFWDEFSKKLGPEICPTYTHAIARLLEFEKELSLNHDGYRVTTTAWNNRTYWMEGDGSHRVAALHHWSSANPGKISFVVRETLEWIDAAKINETLKRHAFYVVNADAELHIVRSLGSYPDWQAVQFHTLSDRKKGFAEEIAIVSLKLNTPIGAAVSKWLEANSHRASTNKRVLNVGEFFRERSSKANVSLLS